MELWDVNIWGKLKVSCQLTCKLHVEEFNESLVMTDAPAAELIIRHQGSETVTRGEALWPWVPLSPPQKESGEPREVRRHYCLSGHNDSTALLLCSGEPWDLPQDGKMQALLSRKKGL